MVVDRRAELTVGLVAALGGEVLPEDRVVDVTTEIERQVLLEQVDRRVVTRLARFFELLDRGVQAGNVVGMVLVMMQFHDLPGDVGIESPVVVGQFWKCVFGHHSS